MDVGNNLPVCLKDHHVQSTVVGQLQEAIVSGTTFITFLFLNKKTSLFCESRVMFIDTRKPLWIKV